MIQSKARYWRRKTVPKFQVEYNTHGFLTASAGLILPAFGNKNFAPSNFAMPSFDGSGCLPIATKYGPSLSANGGYAYKSGSILLGTGPMTVALIFRTTNTNTASNNNVITFFGANQAYDIWGISIENGVVWGRFYYRTISAGSGLNDGLHHTLVMVKPDKANVQSVSIYVDGVALATNPNTNTTTLNIGNGTLLANTTNIFYDEPGSAGQFQGDVPLLAYDNSAWSADQAAYFNEEPFSLFRPRKHRAYFIPAASTSTPVSLSGAAVSVSNASGAISMPMPLSGGATANVSGTGSLTVHVPLSGNAIPTAIASAQIKNLMPLFGSADASTQASGTLSVKNPLSGSATADATGSATVHVKIALSGAAVAKAVAAGTLSVAGSLSGHATASSKVAGTLTQKIPLQSSALIVTHASSNLTETVPLSGAAVIASKAQGALHLVAPMSAHAVSDAVAKGSLALHISLSADAVAQAKASGALTLTQMEAAPDLSVQSPPRNFTARDTRLFTARDDRRIRAA